MLKLSDENAGILREAVREARKRPDLQSRVRALYADVQRQVDLRQPRCDISGRCCRFEEYGHRLFVTTIEIAAFVESLSPVAATSASPMRASEWATQGSQLQRQTTDRSACPYQVNKLCTVHLIRPFGCRIFFCDPTAADWQHAQYEHFHLRLRDLHAELDVPYLYVEWLEALRAMAGR